MNFTLFYLIIPLGIMLLVAGLTAGKDYIFKARVNEREKSIKQKSAYQSWLTLLVFFIANYVLRLCNIDIEPLPYEVFIPSELIYIALAVVSYLLYYLINYNQMDNSYAYNKKKLKVCKTKNRL